MNVSEVNKAYKLAQELEELDQFLTDISKLPLSHGATVRVHGRDDLVLTVADVREGIIKGAKARIIEELRSMGVTQDPVVPGNGGSHDR